MYPKVLKTEKNGVAYEFIYTPGYHESTFDVYDVASDNEKAIFEFEPTENSFSYTGKSLYGFESLIGNHILRTEF